MTTIAFIRLHSFNENPSLVFDSIAEYADKLFFLTSNVKDQSIIEAAGRHPKCAEIRHWTKKWNNHETLLECYKWADEIKPRFVMTFDEDELPPVLLDQAWKEWDKTQAPAMSFKCVWCWNDTNTILKDYHRAFGWHMKICRWSEGMWVDGAQSMNFLTSCTKTPSFACPYPYRHLPIMTEGLREIRKSRTDRMSFWDKPLKTIAYDPSMTYKEWLNQADTLNA